MGKLEEIDRKLQRANEFAQGCFLLLFGGGVTIGCFAFCIFLLTLWRDAQTFGVVVFFAVLLFGALVGFKTVQIWFETFHRIHPQHRRRLTQSRGEAATPYLPAAQWFRLTSRQ